MMVVGVLMLYAWTNSKNKWLGGDNLDQQSAPRMGCLFMCFYLVYFLALVIAPLLGGAMMIVYGLRDC